jgi:uncharacterized protein HemY
MKLIVEAIIGFGFAIWFIAYYAGKLNYSGEKEEERRRRVEQHGIVMILLIVIVIGFSVFLLLRGLFRIGVI